MKFGVIVFPGSNCDRDMMHALQDDLQQEVVMLWHKDRDLSKFSTEDCIILPGGFSYGDYLRCGAIARFSPMMQSVIEFANAGGKVFGVCNGFQILCESGLLPGVLMRNAQLKFICRDVHLRVERSDTPFTRGYNAGQVIKVPVAHGEGNYAADEETIRRLEGEAGDVENLDLRPVARGEGRLVYVPRIRQHVRGPFLTASEPGFAPLPRLLRRRLFLHGE